MMFKKEKKNEPEILEPLELFGDDGDPVMTFPGEVIENVRQLLTRLRKEGEFPKRLALVSALHGEGVTFLSNAIGATLAMDTSSRVCIVDLNWWYPSEPPIVPEENAGLVSVLSGEKTLDDVLVEMGLPNLELLPSGKLSRNARPKTARSEELKNLIEQLDERFDYLILDIPAILASSDSVPLASLADACCLVIQQGVTPLEDVKQALDEIDHLPQLGVILNQITVETPQALIKLVMSV
jgi:Mrp family chromosome partitioning ATPase